MGGGPIVTFCLLALLTAQSVHAHPFRVAEDSTKTIHRYLDAVDISSAGPLPRVLRNSKFRASDETQRYVEEIYRNDEEGFESEHGSHRKIQRDTSKRPGAVATSDAFQSKVYTDPQTKLRKNEGSQDTQPDGKIVFPSDENQREYDLAKPAPICADSTYCETAEFYPEDLVNEAIQRNESLRYLAGVDVGPEIKQRINAMDDVPLCVSDEHVIYPKSAVNQQKQWLFVVNQDNFKQGVRVETCSKQNSSCSVIDGLAEGYNTTCRQKYIYRQLAAVSSDGSVAPDLFQFPSSCCCHVSFTGGPVTRTSLNNVEQRSQKTAAKTRKRK